MLFRHCYCRLFARRASHEGVERLHSEQTPVHRPASLPRRPEAVPEGLREGLVDISRLHETPKASPARLASRICGMVRSQPKTQRRSGRSLLPQLTAGPQGGVAAATPQSPRGSLSPPTSRSTRWPSLCPGPHHGQYRSSIQPGTLQCCSHALLPSGTAAVWSARATRYRRFPML